MAKESKWVDLAAAVLKAAFATVLPAGSSIAGSLIDAGKAGMGLRDSDRAKKATDEIASLMERLVAQLADFDRFEAQVPEDEKRLGREIVATYLAQMGLNYETLESADFDPDSILFEQEPMFRRHLVASALTEAGDEFAYALFRLLIHQILSLVSTLPTFESYIAIQTYLLTKRTPLRLQQTLNQVIVPSMRVGTGYEEARYEAEYREAILRRHSRIEQFGLDDVPAALRWQPLDVTYISLKPSLVLKAKDLLQLAHSTGRSRGLTDGQVGVRRSLEDAIAESIPGYASGKGLRLLVTGAPGSGKTTVVKWLSTRCALGDQGRERLGKLASWADLMPFPVSLALAIPPGNLEVPADTTLIQSLAASTSRPAGWLLTTLSSGRAIIFFDGLDELSPDRRAVAKTWITDICDRFPECTVIVSSRPEAVDLQYFAQSAFSLVEIQSLSSDQARTCVSQWFDAQCDAVKADRADVYRARQRSLENDLIEVPNVRDLAETPLLVAMLCAYYASGSSAGPIDRIKLISSVVEALVDRRDRERGLIPEAMASFTYQRKLEQLGKVALFLFRAGGRSVHFKTVEGTAVLESGDTVLALPSPGPGLDSADTFEHLLTRSVVFNSIGHGEARFAHALFLEYLAGYQLAQSAGGEELIEMEGLPGWYSVAAFYSSSSTGHQAKQFLTQLIARQQTDTPLDTAGRRRLYCLVECLGGMRSYDESLFQMVKKSLQTTMPPTSDEEVALLSTIGSAAIEMLPAPRNATEAQAYIATARRVRGDAAMQLLEEFARGEYRQSLRQSLLAGWTDFNAEEYANRVLGRLDLRGLEVPVETLACAKATHSLKSATRIILGTCEGLKDLLTLEASEHLVQLDLRKARHVSSLDGIQRFSQLRRVRLPSTGSVVDLAPLSQLRKLREIHIGDGALIDSLSPLQSTASLRLIQINKVTRKSIDQLRSGFRTLTGLICNSREPLSLQFLDGLPDLEVLRLQGPRFYHPSAIPGLKALRALELTGSLLSATLVLPKQGALRKMTLCGDFVLDPTSLSNQKDLRYCFFIGQVSMSAGDRIHPLADLSVFTQNRYLERLVVSRNSDLESAQGVEALHRLKYLSLIDTGVSRLEGRDAKSSLWSIDSCEALEEVHLDNCSALTDLMPLSDLPNLRFVSFRGNVWPSALESLMSRPNLEVAHDPWIWNQETG
jgi:hypothetical protein